MCATPKEKPNTSGHSHQLRTNLPKIIIQEECISSTDRRLVLIAKFPARMLIAVRPREYFWSVILARKGIDWVSHRHGVVPSFIYLPQNWSIAFEDQFHRLLCITQRFSTLRCRVTKSQLVVPIYVTAKECKTPVFVRSTIFYASRSVRIIGRIYSKLIGISPPHNKHTRRYEWGVGLNYKCKVKLHHRVYLLQPAQHLIELISLWWICHRSIKLIQNAFYSTVVKLSRADVAKSIKVDESANMS